MEAWNRKAANAADARGVAGLHLSPCAGPGRNCVESAVAPTVR